MYEISVKISSETIGSCNGCGARNYDSSIGIPGKKVDKIYDVIVRNQCTFLCRNCLNRLHDAVLLAIRKDDTQ